MLIRLVPASGLVVAAAVLVSCGSSGTGLIPAVNAGPLKSDFEAVAQTAASGNGNCLATESALGKTEQDFLALPANVDRGLHAQLQKGIANLRRRALSMCTQPTPTATSTTPATTSTTPATTSTTPTTTNTQTTPTTTTPTPTTPTPTPTTTSTTPTTPTPPSQGGGTEAPGEGPGEGKAGAGGAPESGGSGGSNAGGTKAGGGQ